MLLTTQLHASESQTAFNFNDGSNALGAGAGPLALSVAADRQGRLILSPPPTSAHGENHTEPAPSGNDITRWCVVTECPVSTPDEVKAI